MLWEAVKLIFLISFIGLSEQKVWISQELVKYGLPLDIFSKGEKPAWGRGAYAVQRPHLFALEGWTNELLQDIVQIYNQLMSKDEISNEIVTSSYDDKEALQVY